MSACLAKILLTETVKAEEIDKEKWMKLKGRSVASVKGCKNVLGMRFHVAFAMDM